MVYDRKRHPFSWGDILRITRARVEKKDMTLAEYIQTFAIVHEILLAQGENVVEFFTGTFIGDVLLAAFTLQITAFGQLVLQVLVAVGKAVHAALTAVLRIVFRTLIED